MYRFNTKITICTTAKSSNNENILK